MPRPRRLVSSSAAAACAIALSFAPLAARAKTPEPTSTAAAPTIYKWVDENGIAHYTTDRERIPSEIRERVQSRPAVATTNPEAAAQAAHEDVMRDAVRTKPAAGTPTEPLAAPSAAATAAIPAPNPSAAPVAATPVAPAPAASASAPAPAATQVAAPTAAPATVTEVEHGSSVEETVIEQAPAAKTEIVEAPAPMPAPTPTPTPAPTSAPTQVASPAPLDEDVHDETSAVSSPPPAPAVPVDPKEQAQLDELDQKIEAVQGEIAQREETLAALISTPDEQRTTPLVDDPQFREISQRLPKLQADLETLRERRNKIQPAAATP